MKISEIIVGKNEDYLVENLGSKLTAIYKLWLDANGQEHIEGWVEYRRDLL